LSTVAAKPAEVMFIKPTATAIATLFVLRRVNLVEAMISMCVIFLTLLFGQSTCCRLALLLKSSLRDLRPQWAETLTAGKLSGRF
jgi:hypothetical protein